MEEQEMIKNLRLCYRIDKSLGLSVDDDGNYYDAFVCVKAKNVKSYTIDSEEYKDLQERFRVMVANQLKCELRLLTPITLNEYLDNTEED